MPADVKWRHQYGGLLNPIGIPQHVIEAVRGIFLDVNTSVSSLLDNNPNCPEESLDLAWVAALGRRSAPLALAGGWTVSLHCHFVGGLRHYQNWEIADIGVLAFIKSGNAVRVRKVALLQSKRLYPKVGQVSEVLWADYQVGMGRLSDPEDLAHRISEPRQFDFTAECIYQALAPHSHQITAIKDYEAGNHLRVYYQFYNPSKLPFTQVTPLQSEPKAAVGPAVGIQILPAPVVHGVFSSNASNLNWKQMNSLNPRRLEDFVADRFLGCFDGDKYESIDDERIYNLFNRRSGPISAAVRIIVEGPEE
jgi:hypothetical protein